MRHWSRDGGTPVGCEVIYSVYATVSNLLQAHVARRRAALIEIYKT
jgi:hypothetical protein